MDDEQIIINIDADIETADGLKKKPIEEQKRNWKAAGVKAAKKRKVNQAFIKARASEAASKEALRAYAEKNGWKLAFFEGATGSPRTGIIDAIAFRLGKNNADALNVRLIQLKGGKAGINASEISRLKKAISTATISWQIAAYDGEILHVVPEDPKV